MHVGRDAKKCTMGVRTQKGAGSIKIIILTPARQWYGMAWSRSAKVHRRPWASGTTMQMGVLWGQRLHECSSDFQFMGGAATHTGRPVRRGGSDSICIFIIGTYTSPEEAFRMAFIIGTYISPAEGFQEGTRVLSLPDFANQPTAHSILASLRQPTNCAATAQQRPGSTCQG